MATHPKKTDDYLFFTGVEVAPPTSQIFSHFKKQPTEKKSEDKLELNEPLSNKKTNSP
jgi:hypothetical protein